MAEKVVEVTSETEGWLNGGKTYIGISVMLVPVLAGFLGYDVREAFPVEIARFGEESIILIGAILAFYGRWAAKSKAWFTKK